MSRPLPRRYRAPVADGEILADPPLDQVGSLLVGNRQRLDAMPLAIDGMPLAIFRQEARREVLAAVRDYHEEAGEPLPAFDPSAGLLLAGHQPELFHPGVWIKNFALAGLARHHQLTPLNLVVDNDAAKSATLRLPSVSNEPDQVSVVSLPFDQWAGELPYEERRVLDEEQFAALPKAAAEITKPWGYRPFLDDFWPEVLRQRERTPLLGERFVAARRSWERRWGCHNLELPVSRLAGTLSFARFFAHWLHNAAAYATAHNDALRNYRRARRMRSRHHPVPDLAIGDDGWTELPFWAWRTTEPKRARLFAQATASGYRLRFPHGPLVAELPLQGTAEACLRLSAEGLKIRPRALMLTLFARLALAETFLHGIGGGIYDQLTDALAEGCFGIAMPNYLVLSATLRLPLPRFAADMETVRELSRLSRDLHWNPQRHLPTSEAATDERARAKRELAAAGRPLEPQQRRAWFSKLRSLTEALRPLVAVPASKLTDQLAKTRREATANLLMGQRDWSFVWHASRDLQQFLTNVLSHWDVK